MVINENANDLLREFFNKEKVIRVYDALKIGVDNDNLVIIDTYLQNLLTQVFFELTKVVTLEDEDLKDSGQRGDSIKKFIKGEDNRFGVGLDFVLNYVLKNRKLWYNIKALAINENANVIKYYEDKDLEASSTEEIKTVYNSLIDSLNKLFSTDAFNSIAL